MFRSRFFWKLFAGYALLTLVSLTLVGALVARQVQLKTLAEIDQRLLEVATLLSHIVEPKATTTPGPAFEDGQVDPSRVDPSQVDPSQIDPSQIDPSQADLQQEIEKIGESIEVRLTVVSAAGTVLADSEESPSRMEDHSNRQEILDAYESGSGLAVRFSKTLGHYRRYLALPIFVDGQPYATVRASLPLTSLEERLAALRRTIFFVALAATVFALFLGFLYARRVTQPLLSIAEAAERIAEGAYGQRVDAHSHDELGKLARAFNTMSRELEGSVAALSADRNKLTAILSSMAEGVIAIDRDERIVHMNAVAAQLLQVDARQVVGRPIWEVTRLHVVPELLAETMARHETMSRTLILPGASERGLELRAAPLITPDGLAGAVLVVQDVTQLRRLETMRQDFVANVSHELKTPVTAIRGMVETLLDDPEADPDLAQRFLGRVLTQAERMGNLVTDLLSLSRFESESEAFEILPLDLRQPVRESVRLLGPSSEARGITIVTELPETPVWVDGDEEALRQAVSNLLGNAIKYSPEMGKILVRVRIETPATADPEDSSALAGGMATIEVQDHGIGIAAHHRERLFERFYRVDKARSRELGGTGLGLAIVKHIARALGGDVSVESSPGRGSVFRIHLPHPSANR